MAEKQNRGENEKAFDPYLVKPAEKTFSTEASKPTKVYEVNTESAFHPYNKAQQIFQSQKNPHRKESLFKPKKTIGKHHKKEEKQVNPFSKTFLEDQDDSEMNMNNQSPHFQAHPGFSQVPKFTFETPMDNFTHGAAPFTTNNFYNNNYTINYNNYDEKKYIGTVLRPEVCKFY